MTSKVFMSEANKHSGCWALWVHKLRLGFYLFFVASLLVIAGCAGGTTSGTSPGATPPNLMSIAWSGTQFVAVGYQYEATSTGISYGKGIILTSPDGLTWATRLSEGAEGLNRVSWNGSKFVVGGSSAVLTSPDGIHWNQSAVLGGSIRGIAWSGAQFAAVGGDHNEANNTDTGFIFTSPDAITWTPRFSDTAYWLSGITWSGTKFVAVGGSGTGAAILTSPDGLTWTPRTSGSLGDLSGVAWADSQFVAVGGLGNGGSVILTSPDGITWTPRTAGGTYNLLSAAWSGSQFVAVGLNGQIVRSPDGVTWTPVAL